MNYTGLKCPYCNQLFDENSDIVVCPECGTPHHRACYLSHSSCFNSSNHSDSFVWDGIDSSESSNNIVKEETDIEVTCPKCGNPHCLENNYCNQCGHLLLRVNLTEASNSSEFPAEIDGISTDEIVSYIGNNQEFYLYHFSSMNKRNSKVSFNLFAFLFPTCFMIYRNLNKYALITFLCTIVLRGPIYITALLQPVSLPALFNTCASVLFLSSFILNVLSGLFSNRLYFSQIKNDYTNKTKRGTKIFSVLLYILFLIVISYALALIF